MSLQRRLVTLAILLAASAGSALLAAPAALSEPGDPYTPRADSGATVTDDGVTLGIDLEQRQGGSSDPPRSGGRSGSQASCTYTRLDPSDPDVGLLGKAPEGSAWFAIRCSGDAGFTVASLPVGANREPVGPGAIGPYLVALHARDQLPIPRPRIGARPSRALVGSVTWFWLEGYDGRSYTASLTEAGITVEVRAVPSGFTWRFGDGSEPITTRSTGRRYPAESDVTHVYETAMTRADVTCAFTFSVQWRSAATGGAWEALPGIDRTAARTVPVAQSQAVIDR